MAYACYGDRLTGSSDNCQQNPIEIAPCIGAQDPLSQYLLLA